MQSIPLNSKWEKIMVKLCAFVLVMLWAGTGQAALVYLDAAFASDTVAQDSTGLNVVETLTANSSGVVWGGKVANTQIYRITNGVYEEFAVPSPGVGAMQMQDDNTLLVGTYYVGSASGSAKVYQVDSAGVASEFFTLPTGRNRVIKMSVSPVNGDILITANERILKYSSAGVLQWDVVQPLGNQPVTAFNPAGEAIVNGENGALYSIDESTGAFTLLPVSVPTDFEWGASHIFDMVFSNNENVYSSLVSNNNNIEIFRTNLSTGESDMLAHWDFEVPAIERWLEYVDGQGLYLNSFDANDLSFVSESTFGLRSFSLESSGSSVLLLQGDFNGEFAGFSLQSLVPEPSSVWLLLGLGICWKRKLGNRHSPPGKDSR